MNINQKMKIRKRLFKKHWFKVIASGSLKFIIIFALLFLFFALLKSRKQAIWDSKYQLNFVLQADKVMVYSFHPEDNLLNILIIPEKTHIPVVGGFGDYQIGNIYELGKLEKIGGGELLSLSLQSLLAAPIDGYIKLQPTYKIKSETLAKGELLPLLTFYLQGRINTNFSWWDIINLVRKTRGLDIGQVKTVDFLTTGLIKKEILPDKSIILQPDYLRIDELSLELFSDKHALKERISVSVANGTNTPGLAKEAGRLIKNFGAELVNTGDVADNYNNSIIYYRSQSVKNSYTFNKLVKLFKIKEIKADNLMGEEIGLIIGSEFKFLP
jgi:hypothetical protein